MIKNLSVLLLLLFNLGSMISSSFIQLKVNWSNTVVI